MDGYAVVIPTIGRGTLGRCLTALARSAGPAPDVVVLADDRPGRQHKPLAYPACGLPVRVVSSGGAGPAAARNAGWHATTSPWVAFIDDDVMVGRRWREQLCRDLADAPGQVAGVQGVIVVPGPCDRKPTDAERATLGLAGARWITADMAYRRAALVQAGGFDERFPRAFREDADIALRLLADGWQLATGRRHTVHPLRGGHLWQSVSAQAGNADDALMRALHGSKWRRRAGAARGRLPAHLLVATASAAGVALRAAGRRRTAGIAAGIAAAGIAEFAAGRIAAGPALPAEIGAMAVTSAVIPYAATWHWLRGSWLARQAAAWPPPPRAVLFDRDGTLIADVPYNGDPELVRPLPSARQAADLARASGMATGIVTNQSGVARGLITREQVAAVNARVAELLGPFDVIEFCPHGPGDGCGCRKPAPGLINAAADALGMEPHECAVIGDIGADVTAAIAAGARAVLVPAAATAAAELAGARLAPDLLTAVRMLAGHRALPPLWRAGHGRPAGGRQLAAAGDLAGAA
jgi:histidinol-phosphate phosphatase family protein